MSGSMIVEAEVPITFSKTFHSKSIIVEDDVVKRDSDGDGYSIALMDPVLD